MAIKDEEFAYRFAYILLIFTRPRWRSRMKSFAYRFAYILLILTRPGWRSRMKSLLMDLLISCLYSLDQDGDQGRRGDAERRGGRGACRELRIETFFICRQWGSGRPIRQVSAMDFFRLWFWFVNMSVLFLIDACAAFDSKVQLCYC